MRVDEIKNGVVIDHIGCGKAMKIYEMLSLDALETPVAVLRNVPSKAMGKKDIIKIDGQIDINLDVLGFISPNITVDVIRDGAVVEKKHIDLPETLTDILQCKNPRCITSTEQDIHHLFRLTDKEKGVYRCIYCDTKA
ncbi:MAG: aspartate carbamoyltransferase regulatory subunit [Clostridia bacterium]|jgi:aspartate carbamoyltransferase regulatory subunit|nr:aspartate carbamoyltransferase regulatory subunit [Clostridia bacterium]